MKVCHWFHDVLRKFRHLAYSCKVGRAFPMLVVSILSHAESGPNDHRKDAPLFTVLYDLDE